MPELLEFQEVIASHPVVLATFCIAVAVLAAVVTRWVDQKSLDSANERLAAYEDEVRRLNVARADLLARLEERGDDLRRAKAELAGRQRALTPDVDAPRSATPEVASRGSPVPGPRASPDPRWRR
jgi:hypothetical protein